MAAAIISSDRPLNHLELQMLQALSPDVRGRLQRLGTLETRRYIQDLAASRIASRERGDGLWVAIDREHGEIVGRSMTRDEARSGCRGDMGRRLEVQTPDGHLDSVWRDGQDVSDSPEGAA